MREAWTRKGSKMLFPKAEQLLKPKLWQTALANPIAAMQHLLNSFHALHFDSTKQCDNQELEIAIHVLETNLPQPVALGFHWSQ